MAFLSKYAAIYALASLAVHLFLSREARRAWTPVMAIASSRPCSWSSPRT